MAGNDPSIKEATTPAQPARLRALEEAATLVESRAARLRERAAAAGGSSRMAIWNRVRLREDADTLSALAAEIRGLGEPG